MENRPSLLIKNSKVKEFAEKGWYLENIPFIEIPDKNIEEIYYYRWENT